MDESRIRKIFHSVKSVVYEKSLGVYYSNQVGRKNF